MEKYSELECVKSGHEVINKIIEIVRKEYDKEYKVEDMIADIILYCMKEQIPFAERFEVGKRIAEGDLDFERKIVEVSQRTSGTQKIKGVEE